MPRKPCTPLAPSIAAPSPRSSIDTKIDCVGVQVGRNAEVLARTGQSLKRLIIAFSSSPAVRDVRQRAYLCLAACGSMEGNVCFRYLAKEHPSQGSCS